jgi:pantoate--beta-alanine ligase
MHVYHLKSDIVEIVSQSISKNKTIGIVPTMGALHQGHLSLVKKACAENDWVWVSVFVNPTQFDSPSDLLKYPQTLQEDIKKLQSISDAIRVFAPSVKEMYPKKVTAQSFQFDGLDTVMEGAFRKGHFNGVGTIVLELLSLFKANRAYFGEKDFQQLQIIRKLSTQFLLSTDIIACAIEREPSGLAMSSRNVRLNDTLRQEAGFIFQTLLQIQKNFHDNSIDQHKKMMLDACSKHPAFDLEYFEIVDEETLQPVETNSSQKTLRAFVAIKVNEVRLIDNIRLN